MGDPYDQPRSGQSHRDPHIADTLNSMQVVRASNRRQARGEGDPMSRHSEPFVAPVGNA
jgi:hypothetical protein